MVLRAFGEFSSRMGDGLTPRAPGGLPLSICSVEGRGTGYLQWWATCHSDPGVGYLRQVIRAWATCVGDLGEGMG